jgi:hypothetical protein
MHQNFSQDQKTNKKKAISKKPFCQNALMETYRDGVV